MSIEAVRTKLEAMAVAVPAVAVPVPAQAAPVPSPTPLPSGVPVPQAVPVPSQTGNMVYVTDHLKKGYDLDVTVHADRVADAATCMDEDGWMLEAITGVDWMAEQQFEVVYDFTLTATGQRVTIRARVPRATPELPSISNVFGSANWHERETHDFFGIVFVGHPDLIPLLLPEDADFHPLRKDYGA